MNSILFLLIIRITVAQDFIMEYVELNENHEGILFGFNISNYHTFYNNPIIFVLWLIYITGFLICIFTLYSIWILCRK